MFNKFDEEYANTAKFILRHGEKKDDRTGVGTISVFGRMLRFDLRKGFPLLTTKRVPFKSVLSELLWFIEGSGDERRLAEILYGKDRSELTDKTTIWTENANAPYWKPKAKFEGDLGRPYGVQYRNWNGSTHIRTFTPTPPYDGYMKPSTSLVNEKVDQINNLIEGIKKDPFGRRHIVSAWNPGELNEMALPPCHMMYQFSVSKDGYLSCLWTQRSTDFFIGAPFNIASYALLTMMVAQVCDLKPGELIMSTGDTHIYLNHLEQIEEQLTRTSYAPPKVIIDPTIKNIDDFKMEHFTLVDYQSHGKLSAQMAV